MTLLEPAPPAHAAYFSYAQTNQTSLVWRLLLLLFVLIRDTDLLAQTCVQPPPGIINWWPLDETTGNIAEDKVGSHSGAYANGPVPTAGKVRGALRFNGSNYVAAQDSDTWALGARDFTIELWANFATPGGGDIGHPSHIFIGNDEGPGNRNKWFWALGGGYLNFHINSPTLGPQFFPLVPFSPTVGVWYHLAIVRRGSTYTIFINGTPSGSASNANAIPNPNAPLTIGQAEGLGFVNGVLDEISVYSRALAPEEIKAIHDVGTAGKCISLQIRPTSGGDTGGVTVHVSGAGFAQGANLKLVAAGRGDIVATNVTVVADGTALDGSFDLEGKPQGEWNVVVTNPGGVSFTLNNGFTIEAGRAPQVWVDILGLNLIRPGRAQSFQLLVGNRSNVDAIGVPVWIAGIPRNAVLKLGFPVLPPYESVDPSIDYSAVPTTVDTGTDIEVPLLLPVVPAGSSNAFEFTVTVSSFQGFTLRAWSNPPIYTPSASSPIAAELVPSEEFVNCSFAILEKLYKEPVTEEVGKCVFATINAFRKVLLQIGRQRGSAVNLFWTIEKWLSSCAQGGACFLCPGGVLTNQSCVVCWALRLLNDSQKLWGLWKDCLNAGIEIGDIFKDIAAIFSFDPNDKVGSQGATAAQFISGQEPLRYSVLFENLETATAAAQEVTISDALDMTHLDLNTLALGPVAVANKQVLPPPGATTFATDMDLRPEKNLLVRTTVSLNPSTGLLTWRLRSIDPATGNPPTDPRVGFLPPDVHPPEGDGNVVFTVMVKRDLPTGTEIRNKSTIVFDFNAPIDTPEWLNTLDNSNPRSRVFPLPATQESTAFPVQWSGDDEGSGIQDFTVYVSDNGGSFIPWLTNTTATQGTYVGIASHSYRFYGIARDFVRNMENAKAAAEATTIVLIQTVDLGVTKAALPLGSVVAGSNVTYTTVATNSGPSSANDVTLTDSVSVGTSFVSLAAPGGWSCITPAIGTSGNISCTKPSMANGETATFTVVAMAKCNVPNNTSISNTATITAVSPPDNNDDNNGQTVVRTVSNPVPIISATVMTNTLWPPNHDLVNVGLAATASDGACPAPTSFSVQVFGNEDDQTPTDPKEAAHSPDAKNIGIGTLRLRAQRIESGNGRVYLIVVKTTDAAN